MQAAGIRTLHLDVMDGRFVPNLTYGMPIVEACRRLTDLPLDVHLMIETPDARIPDFAKAGADYISVHAEACPHLHRSLQLIKSLGAKAGVALNPATPLSSIEYVIDLLDFVLIMSVNPGFGGQKFIDSSLNKITALSKMLSDAGSNAIIQVDGGVNNDTMEAVTRAGARCFVAGSAIFNTPDYKKTIDGLRKLSEKGKK